MPPRGPEDPMTDSPDVRVTDALDALPKKERRHLLHAPFRSSLDALVEQLDGGETVRAMSGAVNSHLGRGVLALTDDRLVFCCPRTGPASWSLAEIKDVETRRGSFTLPSALTLHLESERLVFALNGGKAAATAFCEAVRSGREHALSTTATA